VAVALTQSVRASARMDLPRDARSRRPP
jgi:hypothetical protein